MALSRAAALAACAIALSLPAHAQFGGLGNLLQGLASNPAAAAAAAGASTQAVSNATGSDAVAAPAPAAPVPAYSEAELQAIVQEAPAALDLSGAPLKSNLALKGKRFYIAEYRVSFEVGGRVTASTRAAYFGGIDRGATRVTVQYAVPQPNFALLQAITDRAYADFLAQLEAAGLKPEPAEAMVREHGAIYEATADATRPDAPVAEEADVGYGTRRYLVFAPQGMKLVPRGFAGMGAGDIGKRIAYSKGNLEALSVGVVVNLAAQESSGSGSSMFRRGSSANASAAMELAVPHRHLGLVQSHANTQTVGLGAPVPVPGQFANFRETGGYDSSKDAAVRGLQVLGALTMGVAGTNTKRVEMAIDVDQGAMARQALQGLAGLHKAIAAAIN